MKFKVGDKVRVREDLVVGNFYDVGSFVDSMQYCKGEVFEITDVAGRTYILGGIWFRWTDEMLEEVKKEVQEKTFREVIADIKEGEIWDSGYKEIRLYNGEIMIVSKDSSFSMVFYDSTKYKLKRQLYSFEEAFKAYEEGKEIESVYSLHRYKKENGEDVAIFIADWQEFDYFELYEIRGKWYINN